MKESLFEKQFDVFLQKQKEEANPRRLEMLEKDLTGTIKLFKEALWPVFKSFEGFELEYEIKGPNGVSIFLDVFNKPFRSSFECEGYSAHAETITRSRFDFEKQRVRTMLLHGITYIPFSYDELDKKGHLCKSFVRDLLAKLSSGIQSELTLYEREVIRRALELDRPIRLKDINECLGKKRDFSRRVINSLLQKQLIQAVGPGTQRNHRFVLVDDALRYVR